jgi:hypothetical protein
MNELKKLQLITGSLSSGFRIGSVQVVPGTSYSAPFSVAARVCEEDIWRLLSADTELRESDEHSVRLMTDLISQQAIRPGSLLLDDRRWLAVVVDLDSYPVCRGEWVVEALDKVFRQAAERRITSLGIPLIGSIHGNLYWQKSLWLILDALDRSVEGFPERIWLIVPPERLHGIGQMLERAANGNGE